MTLASRLARLSPATVRIWRRPWADALRKRKLHGYNVQPEQRARWEALDQIAADVLRQKDATP